jgi:hypothetical protein
VRFHIPTWLYHTLAAIGGFGFLFQQVLKPMLISAINRYHERHDEAVWQIVKQRKRKIIGTQGDKPMFSQTQEVGYSVEEIAKDLNRALRSVRASFGRLEKRGRVIDTSEGWRRKG